MNILFICRYNCFRSKIAEAYYNSQAKEAKSAGYMPGIPISKGTFACAKELGLELDETTQGITHDLTLWSDTIIIIDDFNSTPIFSGHAKRHGKKLLYWNIPDVIGDSVADRVATAKKILARIDEEL